MTQRMKKKNKTPYQNWLVPGVIALVFLGAVGFLVKVLLTDDGPRKKNQISTVTLLKPPPPEVKEKLPEPEVPKEAPKETMVAPDTPQSSQDQPQEQSQDNTPAGSDLGVDGEGGAGSDGFGLVGKKGGRAITLGGGGGGMNRLNLLAKYGWYVQKVQDEVRQQVKKQLEEDGGIPKGKFQTFVKVILNNKGTIIDFRITNSSGHQKIDKAVKEALVGIRISEPLPDGMPNSMTIKVASQG